MLTSSSSHLEKARTLSEMIELMKKNKSFLTVNDNDFVKDLCQPNLYIYIENSILKPCPNSILDPQKKQQVKQIKKLSASYKSSVFPSMASYVKSYLNDECEQTFYQYHYRSDIVLVCRYKENK